MKQIYRQLILFLVGAAFILSIAWIHEPAHSIAKQVYNSDKVYSNLDAPKTAYPKADKGDVRKENYYWVEPVKLNKDGTADYNSGLYYIQLISEYKTSLKFMPYTGMIMVYKRSFEFFKNPPKAAKNQWELLFIERIPGPIKSASLDRSMETDYNGDLKQRKLAISYKHIWSENTENRVRVYNIDSLCEQSGTKIDKDIPEADLPKMSYQSKYGHICPLINGTVSQDVLEDQRFVHCVGRENVMFKSDDYIIPGSMMVTELSINNGTLVYSLAEDSFRFRMAPIPDSPYCNRKEREIKRLHSIEGPYLGDYNGDRVKQSSLVFLPAETTNSIDILNSQGWFDSGVFIFKLHLIKKDVKTRNSQNSAKNDESDKPVVVSEDWRRIQLLGYRVTMGDLRDLRNLNEYKLMHQKPIVLQTPLTTVVYFPATDIVLTVDTKWKKDLNGNYYQEHEPKAYEVPFTSALGESALSHIDVDDTGSVLVMRTTDDDLAILRRSLSPDQNVFDYRSFVTTPENFKDIKPIIRNSEAVKEGKPLKPPKNMLTNWKEWQMWFENVDIQQSSPWTDGMIVNEFGPMVNIIRVQDQANKGGLSSNKQHISSTRFVRIRNKDLTGATNKKINVGANNPIMNMLYSGEDRNSENGSDESTLFLISVNKDSKTKVWILNNESINNKHAVWQFFVNRWGYALQMIFIIFACIYNEQRWPS